MPVNEAPVGVVEATDTSTLANFSSDVGVYGNRSPSEETKNKIEKLLVA